MSQTFSTLQKHIYCNTVIYNGQYFFQTPIDELIHSLNDNNLGLNKIRYKPIAECLHQNIEKKYIIFTALLGTFTLQHFKTWVTKKGYTETLTNPISISMKSEIEGVENNVSAMATTAFLMTERAHCDALQTENWADLL